MIGYVIEWRDVTELRMQRALIDALDTTQCVCEFSPDNRVMRCNENFRRAWAQKSRIQPISTFRGSIFRRFWFRLASCSSV